MKVVKGELIARDCLNRCEIKNKDSSCCVKNAATSMSQCRGRILSRDAFVGQVTLGATRLFQFEYSLEFSCQHQLMEVEAGMVNGATGHLP